MRRFAFVALAALSACTHPQWEKAGSVPGQLAVDEGECQKLAKQQAAARSGPNSRGEPYFGRNSMVFPTGAASDAMAHQLILENRLAQDCMESKGYKLGTKPASQH